MYLTIAFALVFCEEGEALLGGLNFSPSTSGVNSAHDVNLCNQERLTSKIEACGRGGRAGGGAVVFGCPLSLRTSSGNPG